ncbi:hypothetical protein B0H19DRAFT_1141565 [Mycena capillaripes]|nr:hypothetical protein B0H19DRAFT_1141565 [Mycena capillaripes]
MPSIPDDLIPSIVQELEHDRTSLKACSLVGSSFRSPSQRRLFHSMWLHPNRIKLQVMSRSVVPSYSGEYRVPSSTIRRASTLLSGSPHLASYIRHLTIELTTSPDEAALLEQFLQKVRNLETFAISGTLIDWNRLLPALASTILNVIALPSLSRLHLWSMENIPATLIFTALSSMVVLSIDETTVAHTSIANSSSSGIASRLEQLILSTDQAEIYALIHSPGAPTLRNVRRLLLHMSEKTGPGAERLLSSLFGTLTHLVLDYGDFAGTLRFPTLPTLCSITLQICCGFTQRFIPEGLAETLTRLPRAALTLVFATTAYSWAEPRPNQNPLVGLENWEMPHSIRCQLLFIGRGSDATREAAFFAFGIIMRAALPHFQLDISIAEEARASHGDGLDNEWVTWH